MKKIIYIEDNDETILQDRYVLVELLPVEGRIKFVGVFKEKSKQPVDMTIEYRGINIINRDLIEVLAEIASGLDEKISNYKEILNTLSFIKRIEIPE